MKIGLVRHFEVLHYRNKFMNSNDYRNWVIHYDSADVRENEVNLMDIRWDKCFSSDLPRALKTAKAIYSGEIEKTPLLREIRLDPFIDTQRLFPYEVWDVAGRIAWIVSHKSQSEKSPETINRVRSFIKYLLRQPEENILIVSHAGLMWYLQRELRRNGFKGKRFTKAKNGRLYLFEK